MNKDKFTKILLYTLILITFPLILLSSNFNKNNIIQNSNKYSNKISNSFEVKQVETGISNSAAIVVDDFGEHLYMWGADKNHGYSFIDMTKNMDTSWTINKVELGRRFYGVVINDGERDHLYAGNYDSSALPVDLTALIDKNIIIKDISMENNHSLMIVNDGERDHLYACGDNHYGQLGDGTTTSSEIPIDITVTMDPTWEIVDVDTGYNTSSAIVRYLGRDHLYTWGRNDEWQLGFSGENKYPYDITKSMDSSWKIKKISMGYNHTAAIINDGESDHLYTWGNNDYFQLGTGSIHSSFNFHDITSSFGTFNEIKDIELGNSNSIAIINDENGDHFYVWGNGGDYIFKESIWDIEYYTPNEIFTTYDEPLIIKQTVIAYDHIITIVNDGESDHIITWGENNSGQLGIEPSFQPSKTYYNYERPLDLTRPKIIWVDFNLGVLQTKNSVILHPIFSYDFSLYVNGTYDVTIKVEDKNDLEKTEDIVFNMSSIDSTINLAEKYDFNAMHSYNLYLEKISYTNKNDEYCEFLYERYIDTLLLDIRNEVLPTITLNNEINLNNVVLNIDDSYFEDYFSIFELNIQVKNADENTIVYENKYSISHNLNTINLANDYSFEEEVNYEILWTEFEFYSNYDGNSYTEENFKDLELNKHIGSFIIKEKIKPIITINEDYYIDDVNLNVEYNCDFETHVDDKLMVSIEIDDFDSNEKLFVKNYGLKGETTINLANDFPFTSAHSYKIYLTNYSYTYNDNSYVFDEKQMIDDIEIPDVEIVKEIPIWVWIIFIVLSIIIILLIILLLRNKKVKPE